MVVVSYNYQWTGHVHYKNSSNVCKSHTEKQTVIVHELGMNVQN